MDSERVKSYAVEAIKLLEPHLEDYLYIYAYLLETVNHALMIYQIKEDITMACDRAMPRLERIKYEKDYNSSTIPWCRFLYDCYYKEFMHLVSKAVEATRKASGRRLEESALLLTTVSSTSRMTQSAV